MEQLADAHLFDTHKVFSRYNVDVITDDFSLKDLLTKRLFGVSTKVYFLSLNVYILIHTLVWFLQ